MQRKSDNPNDPDQRATAFPATHAGQPNWRPSLDEYATERCRSPLVHQEGRMYCDLLSGVNAFFASRRTPLSVDLRTQIETNLDLISRGEGDLVTYAHNESKGMRTVVRHCLQRPLTTENVSDTALYGTCAVAIPIAAHLRRGSMSHYDRLTGHRTLSEASENQATDSTKTKSNPF